MTATRTRPTPAPAAVAPELRRALAVHLLDRARSEADAVTADEVASDIDLLATTVDVRRALIGLASDGAVTEVPAVARGRGRSPARYYVAAGSQQVAAQAEADPEGCGERVYQALARCQMSSLFGAPAPRSAAWVAVELMGGKFAPDMHACRRLLDGLVAAGRVAVVPVVDASWYMTTEAAHARRSATDLDPAAAPDAAPAADAGGAVDAPVHPQAPAGRVDAGAALAAAGLAPRAAGGEGAAREGDDGPDRRRVRGLSRRAPLRRPRGQA